MKLLLDTHAFLWFGEGSPKLPVKVRTLLIDRGVAVSSSIASLWEIAIKVNLGRLTLNRPFPDFVRDRVVAESIDILPIEASHLEQLRSLPLGTRTPSTGCSPRRPSSRG